MAFDPCQSRRRSWGPRAARFCHPSPRRGGRPAAPPAPSPRRHGLRAVPVRRRSWVPEPDGLVIRARGEAAVRQHCQRGHRPPWPSNRAVSAPVLVSQSRTVPSPEPEARRPSGNTASASHPLATAFEPCCFGTGLDVPEPHGLVMRARGEASVRQHRQRRTHSPGLRAVPVSVPVLRSQSRMVLSEEPEARRPSGSTVSAVHPVAMAFEPCQSRRRAALSSDGRAQCWSSKQPAPLRRRTARRGISDIKRPRSCGIS